MARLISATGVKSNVAIGSPQEGMKWIVRWVLVVLYTSTTTGNRRAGLFVSRANAMPNTPTTLADTGTQSGTSSIYTAGGDATSMENVNTNVNVFYQFPEIYAVDVINFYLFAPTGDIADYYIMVEEVPS